MVTRHAPVPEPPKANQSQNPPKQIRWMSQNKDSTQASRIFNRRSALRPGLHFPGLAVRGTYHLAHLHLGVVDTATFTPWDCIVSGSSSALCPLPPPTTCMTHPPYVVPSKPFLPLGVLTSIPCWVGRWHPPRLLAPRLQEHDSARRRGGARLLMPAEVFAEFNDLLSPEVQKLQHASHSYNTAPQTPHDTFFLISTCVAC